MLELIHFTCYMITRLCVKIQLFRNSLDIGSKSRIKPILFLQNLQVVVTLISMYIVALSQYFGHPLEFQGGDTSGCDHVTNHRHLWRGVYKVLQRVRDQQLVTSWSRFSVRFLLSFFLWEFSCFHLISGFVWLQPF